MYVFFLHCSKPSRQRGPVHDSVYFINNLHIKNNSERKCGIKVRKQEGNHTVTLKSSYRNPQYDDHSSEKCEPKSLNCDKLKSCNVYNMYAEFKMGIYLFMNRIQIYFCKKK